MKKQRLSLDLVDYHATLLMCAALLAVNFRTHMDAINANLNLTDRDSLEAADLNKYLGLYIYIFQRCRFCK